LPAGPRRSRHQQTALTVTEVATGLSSWGLAFL
jgi:hypothetical protein